MNLVCISDMHSLHPSKPIPNGDVLVVAGDFCNKGYYMDVLKFNSFLKGLPHKNKVVIAGNHDIIFEEDLNLAKSLLDDSIHYLQDSEVVIDGVKFYGSPWQPEFFNWSFNLPRGEKLKEKWDMIPVDTDILITHGPPKGILDTIKKDSNNLGCEDLWNTVKRIKPKVHIFGHIHGGHGVLKHSWVNGFSTTFINASICTERYRPINKPIEVTI